MPVKRISGSRDRKKLLSVHVDQHLACVPLVAHEHFLSGMHEVAIYFLQVYLNKESTTAVYLIYLLFLTQHILKLDILRAATPSQLDLF